MSLSKTKEWLERVLQTDHLDEEGFRQLLRDCREERQHLDFKSGLEFSGGDPATTLRDYAAAFGNSDGGLIVFGYDEKGQRVDGVPPVGNTSPHDWAARTLASLAGYFSPPPRIIESQVEGKVLLVVAVARAPRLVPLVNKGDLIYRIRLGDSNVTVPPWLMSDLVLGRRSAPQLEMRGRSGKFHGQPEELVVNVLAGRVVIDLEIENAGLLDADGIRIGLVGFVTPTRDGYEQAGPSLLAYVENRGADRYAAQTIQPPWLLAHIRANQYDFGLMSFEKAVVSITLPVPLFMSDGGDVAPPKPEPGNMIAELAWEREVRNRTLLRGRVRHEWALYMVTRNAEPWFFQVRATYEGRDGKLKKLDIGPPEGSRPIVCSRFVGVDEEP